MPLLVVSSLQNNELSLVGSEEGEEQEEVMDTLQKIQAAEQEEGEIPNTPHGKQLVL